MVTATASEVFVETLRLEGVRTAFGLVGSAFMDPLDLFPAAGIHFVAVRHEQNAALMADGFARAGGGVGVCIGQNGPGVTNLVTGVAQAHANHTPMLVITPSVTSTSVGTHAIQEVDQMKLFAGLTNYQVQVNRPDKLAWAMRNALRAAILTSGPAQVDIPRDYFYGEFAYDALVPAQYRIAAAAGQAPEADVSAAARILRQARRPLILAGLGVTLSGCAADVARLAERIAAPVATVYLHNDAFSARHPAGVGPIGYGGSKAAMRMATEADAVLALGTRLNGFGTIPHYDLDYWPKDAQLIHNDSDPLQLGKERPIAVGLAGDAGAVTRQLLTALGQADEAARERSVQRRREAGEQKARWAAELERMSSSPDVPIHPRRALWEATRALPRDAIVTTDVGNVSGTANAYLDFDKPRQFLAAGTLGGIGVAFSTALGAKLARPGQPVVALCGDGAWSMTIQEIMTAVTENIPVVALIMNNREYGAEKRNQYDYFDERFFFTDLDNPDFAQVAEDMGAFATSVERPEDVGPAVRAAIASNRPAVVNVWIDPKILTEPYRRDAFQYPVRRLERYSRSQHAAHD